jgi:protease II
MCRSTIEVDLNSQTQTILKQQTVPLYDRSLYESKRISYPARDGVMVPCSMVCVLTVSHGIFDIVNELLRWVDLAGVVTGVS